MEHPIYRVTAVELLGGFRLQISFDDGSTREINLEDVLEGEIYGPLRDPALFGKVSIDPEVHTLVWPNGADFDPAILHDWPKHEQAMLDLAQKMDTGRCVDALRCEAAGRKGNRLVAGSKPFGQRRRSSPIGAQACSLGRQPQGIRDTKIS